MQVGQQEHKTSYMMQGEQILQALFPNSSPLSLAKHSTRTYKKEEHIYDVNDTADSLYLIASGRVKIGSGDGSDKSVIKSILGENDLFGEMALTGELLRVDYAEALEDNTKIYLLSTEEVLEMMRENKPLSDQILKILGSRVRRTEKRLVSLLHKDARTRIIDFLRDLAIEKGRKVGFETLIKNHFTHKEMASLTGTSRQTVTTVLNRLKEKNIINFDRRRILIRDMDLLN